jgi:two-component system, chemotaxis family, response regulator Rcp1
MNKPFELLLVEDNEGDVEMIRRSLRDATPACNLTVVNDGMEALDYLFKRGNFQSAARPRLIILDLNMPGMNGKEALKVIKANEQVKNIPVVVFTSSDSPMDIQESYAQHANCYVVKPFDGGVFKTAIRNIVNFWGNLVLLPHDAPKP